MVQALGRIVVTDLLQVLDLASLSFHKTGGPAGVGVLITASSVAIDAAQLGGGQEHGRRAGTEPVALAVAAAKTVELAVAETPSRAASMAAARNLLQARLLDLDDVFVLAADAQRLPNTCCACIAGVDGRSLLLALDLEGIAASMGSACSARSPEPSAALLAMGLTPDQARATVRFSFGNDASAQQAAEAVEVIERVVKRLRRTKRMRD
jgi:cysteine desulfurase